MRSTCSDSSCFSSFPFVRRNAFPSWTIFACHSSRLVHAHGILILSPFSRVPSPFVLDLHMLDNLSFS
jgi:hypothetical protein